MSTYFSGRVRIAGRPEDVALFHEQVLLDEQLRPSETFKSQVIASGEDGRTTAMQYEAGKSRYRPAVVVFAKSVDAANIDVITELAEYFESGEQSCGVYRGKETLFKSSGDRLASNRRDRPADSGAPFAQAAHAFGVAVQLRD